jgi:DNA-binding response OmpR family regulator
MRILVVDDDDAIRALLIDVLLDEGYQVVAAANGREALTYLRKSMPLPNLIILDLMMPLMSGRQFLQAQKQEPAIAVVPIIAISAVKDQIDEVVPLGISSYLLKPFDIDTMLSTVAALRV